ncbi:hypothetical protein [Rhodococcoides fascians]|uniref:hypothetical protein n=1 Tax=Rhodococcoides fascians TaxID=1828 RepID=UPI00050BEE9E|nr:hypothetical protein [Rhodococcus fascians]
MPNHDAPEGALVQGGRFSQDVTAETAKQIQTAAARDALELAADGFNEKLFRRVAATRATLADGQNNFAHRLDLLDNAAGHVSAVMGMNWMIPHNKWVVLPFDNQIGPAKKAAVVKPSANSGWLALKAGGLWRVDAHVTVSGYTSNVTYLPVIYPPYFVAINTYSPIKPVFLLEVMTPAGKLLTSRRFDAVTPVAVEQQGFVGVNFPNSSAFSHTFVVEEIAPDAPPEQWVWVRLSMSYTIVADGTFSFAECQVKGGTKLSSLIASRWSKDAVNAIDAPTVPDGGTLT